MALEETRSTSVDYLKMMFHAEGDRIQAAAGAVLSSQEVLNVFP